jgi:ParB family chromosome partitioning protein
MGGPKASDGIVGFKTVPVIDLVESKTNPRRTFTAAGIDELAESIKDKGILTPLLVRSVNAHYEIVDGARRYRAAAKAGLQEIPVIVRNLDDQAVMEIQVISNLQREDVHPLEEADGYRALIERFHYTAESIADKVGKSTAYVWQRIQLARLVPELKKAFTAGEIGLSHAQLLCRLQPADQARAEKSGLFESRWRPSRVRGKAGREVAVPVTAAALRNWIEEECHLTLADAPWKKDDASLLQGCQPCSTCPKRTGCDKLLWPDDAKGDTCTDPACYKAKLAAHVAAKERELVAGGAKAYRISTPDHGYHSPSDLKKAGVNLTKGLVLDGKAKRCEAAVKGIIVVGNQVGHVRDICLDPTTCPVHKANVRKDRYQESGYSERYQASPKELARRKAQLAAEKRKVDVKRLAIVQVLAKVEVPLAGEDLRAVALGYYADVWHEFRKRIAARRGWPLEAKRGFLDYGKLAQKQFSTMDDAEVHRFMLEIFLTKKVEGSNSWGNDDGPSFAAIAKSHGVNLKAIESSLAKAEKVKKDIQAIKGELVKRKKAGGKKA